MPTPASSTPVIDAYLRDADWVGVSSSTVRRIAYLPDFKYLFVEYKGGGTYLYETIGPDMWRGFLGAPSKGQWVYYVLRNKGRDDRYPYRRVA